MKSSNIGVANKTLILRSANDELKDDLSKVKNYEDVFKHVVIPTTEPPDFMGNYKLSGLSLTTKKTTKFSTPSFNWYIETPKAEENWHSNHFVVTLPQVAEPTKKYVPQPPREVSLDSAEFWSKVFSNGFWNHLDFQLNLSYVTDPKRTSTYATKLTTGRAVPPKTKFKWMYYPSQLPLVTEVNWPTETDDNDERRRGGTVVQKTPPILSSTMDTTK